MTTRVLFVTPDYPTADGRAVGGVGSACHNLVAALEGFEEFKTHVLVAPALTGRESFGNDPTSPEQHKVTRLAPLPDRWHPLDALWSRVHVLSRAIRRIPHDVLHVQGMDLLAGIHAGARTILTLHGVIERDSYYRGGVSTRWIRRALMGWLCRRARAAVPNLIAINPYNREFLKLGSAHRVWDIPNAVRESCFLAHRAPEAGRVLMAGRVTARKNVLGAIRAFASAARAHPQATLRIAGDGDPTYITRCMQLANNLGLSDRVVLLGSLTATALELEMARCHCLLHCSLQETAPLVFSEAMAIGAPIVATDAGGARFMITPGTTGLIAPAGNVDCIAACLRTILLSPDEAADMGARAREVARATYHPAVIGHRTVDVYRAVLRAGASRTA